MLGGELGNSSAGTAAQADTILPRLAGLHFNTVLMPVAWDEIEPQEGRFDFSVLDHWVDVAQEQHVHLVLLWFGSWKNAFSNYAPEWVLTDTRRFPRAISAEGLPTEILSPLGAETARCDARAFAALMRHVREKDAAQQTVLMVQVENEIGYLGVGGRDRSEAANKLFTEAVPGELMARVKSGAGFATGLNPAGRNWKEVFGGAADEDFVAWEYGLFAQQVAAAGKKEYALPMYMNAQLPAEKETAGDYPSGGPYPTTQAIYRAAAPAIDFYAPDIYWPDFSGWVDEYAAAANPVFVPEARLDAAPMNAMYLYGEARGFGFSPFAVDSLPAADSQGKSEDKGSPQTGPGLGRSLWGSRRDERCDSRGAGERRDSRIGVARDEPAARADGGAGGIFVSGHAGAGMAGAEFADQRWRDDGAGDCSGRVSGDGEWVDGDVLTRS